MPGVLLHAFVFFWLYHSAWWIHVLFTCILWGFHLIYNNTSYHNSQCLEGNWAGAKLLYCSEIRILQKQLVGDDVGVREHHDIICHRICTGRKHVSFFPDPHKRHPIALQWGWGMGYHFVWILVWFMVYILWSSHPGDVGGHRWKQPPISIYFMYNIINDCAKIAGEYHLQNFNQQ